MRLAFLLLTYAYAQEVIELPGEWSLFAVDGLYHIYGWDATQRAFYKLWAPRYDSLTRIGGAPGPEGFLSVASIAPIGNQQVYVLDAEGQKIMLLGTNLQPLQRLTYAQLPSEVAEGFPVLLTASSGTELYLLLRETQEILKVDAFGRVLLRFGGKVYGTGFLAGAAFLHAEGDKVFVVDTIRRAIIEYDSWGNYLQSVPFPPEMKKGWASEKGRVFWRNNLIRWEGMQLMTYTCPVQVRAVWIQGRRLYWLGERQIGWFPLP
ncbi:MAG: hypothetical protein RMK19_08220 [Bacteroidia bacterium]|nr:hypothetical protein [Bacteroidia bacterium]MDW8015982.1 hypothetical protein [Bacteroidia bacterium]